LLIETVWTWALIQAAILTGAVWMSGIGSGAGL
jgi:hypothetical protein